jgi:hypothetical protein
MKTSLLLLLFSLPFIAFTQPKNIMISDTLNPEEPSIFINPKNPAMIMAGANINKTYLSLDTGRTWTMTQVTSNSGVWGDPCISADTAGNFLYLHLANPPAGQGNWIDRIVFQKYDTQAQSWTTDSYIGLSTTANKAQDKEWIAVDPNNNNMYVTWTEFDTYGSTNPLDSSRILFSKSTDGGVTWSSPLRLSEQAGNCIDSDSTVEGAVPAVGPNGEIYVAWAGPDGLVFDRSTDQGATWLTNDIAIDPMPGGWDYDVTGISRCNGLPITKCDVSGGAYNGTIYVNWTDQRNGQTNVDVFLAKSTDGGDTWSTPVRVNDDTTQRAQFLTWMDVDQSTGYLYFIFYDRRNQTNNLTDVYLAVSKDGGTTFENYQISESPFMPAHTIFFGDYNNISVQNGIVRPIWTRLHYGKLSIWTALIKYDSQIGIKETKAQTKSLEANIYPNPSSDEVYFSFKLHEKESVNIKVIDVDGKLISNLVQNKTYAAGMYIERFSPSHFGLSTGAYYFILTTDNSQITKKFIIKR